MSNVKEIGEKILKGTIFGVSVEDKVVRLLIGKNYARMDYKTALRMSALLRNAGRQAKKNAGDESLLFTVYADLTDANLDELKAQRSRDRTAVFGKV